MPGSARCADQRVVQVIPADYLELEHCAYLCWLSLNPSKILHIIHAADSPTASLQLQNSNAMVWTPDCSSPRTGLRWPRWRLHLHGAIILMSFSATLYAPIREWLNFWLQEAISERMVDIGKQDMRNQTDSTNYNVNAHDFLLFLY